MTARYYATSANRFVFGVGRKTQPEIRPSICHDRANRRAFLS